jgi:hypothetical protein
MLSVVWAPAFVFFLHQVSVWVTNGEYWWDEPMHVAGGMAIAWMGTRLLRVGREYRRIPVLPQWFTVVVLGGFVMTAGVIWEWYEYIRWIAFDPTMELTLADTLKDLVMDAVGGAMVAVAASKTSAT